MARRRLCLVLCALRASGAQTTPGGIRLPAALRAAGPAALWHPELLAAAALLAFAYLWAAGPMRRRRGAAAEPLRRRAAFVAGVGCLYAAQGSPVAILANEYLVSAHMLQMVLLLFWSPPLLLAGAPERLLRAALLPLRGVLSVLTRPVASIPLFALTFCVYLFPVATEAALADPWLYLAEHAVCFAAALLLWWPLVGRLPEIPPLPEPAQLAYAFLIELSMTAAFAIVTFSPVPLYPTYARGAVELGVPPLGDQQVAGIVMRLGSMASFGAAFARAFLRWVRRGDAGLPARLRLPQPERPRGER